MYCKDIIGIGVVAEEIMDNHRIEWSKGPGSDYNVIKKWLDRMKIT